MDIYREDRLWKEIYDKFIWGSGQDVDDVDDEHAYVHNTIQGQGMGVPSQGWGRWGEKNSRPKGQEVIKGSGDGSEL